MQTISTGMPRLCVSVFSLSGSTTASSSPAVGARLCGEDELASSGSAYSWNAFTTWRRRRKYGREIKKISANNINNVWIKEKNGKESQEKKGEEKKINYRCMPYKL